MISDKNSQIKDLEIDLQKKSEEIFKIKNDKIVLNLEKELKSLRASHFALKLYNE